MNIASILWKKRPSVANLAIKYNESASSAVNEYANVIVKASVVKIKYNAHEITENKVTFLKSFVSFKKGGKKYK